MFNIVKLPRNPKPSLTNDNWGSPIHKLADLDSSSFFCPSTIQTKRSSRLDISNTFNETAKPTLFINSLYNYEKHTICLNFLELVGVLSGCFCEPKAGPSNVLLLEIDDDLVFTSLAQQAQNIKPLDVLLFASHHLKYLLYKAKDDNLHARFFVLSTPKLAKNKEQKCINKILVDDIFTCLLPKLSQQFVEAGDFKNYIRYHLSQQLVVDDKEFDYQFVHEFSCKNKQIWVPLQPQILSTRETSKKRYLAEFFFPQSSNTCSHFVDLVCSPFYLRKKEKPAFLLCRPSFLPKLFDEMYGPDMKKIHYYQHKNKNSGCPFCNTKVSLVLHVCANYLKVMERLGFQKRKFYAINDIKDAMFPTKKAAILLDDEVDQIRKASYFLNKIKKTRSFCCCRNASIQIEYNTKLHRNTCLHISSQIKSLSKIQCKYCDKLVVLNFDTCDEANVVIVEAHRCKEKIIQPLVELEPMVSVKEESKDSRLCEATEFSINFGAKLTNLKGAKPQYDRKYKSIFRPSYPIDRLVYEKAACLSDVPFYPRPKSKIKKITCIADKAKLLAKMKTAKKIEHAFEDNLFIEKPHNINRMVEKMHLEFLNEEPELVEILKEELDHSLVPEEFAEGVKYSPQLFKIENRADFNEIDLFQRNRKSRKNNKPDKQIFYYHEMQEQIVQPPCSSAKFIDSSIVSKMEKRAPIFVKSPNLANSLLQDDNIINAYALLYPKSSKRSPIPNPQKNGSDSCDSDSILVEKTFEL